MTKDKELTQLELACLHADEITPLPDGGTRVRKSAWYKYFDKEGRHHRLDGPASCQVHPHPEACEHYYVHGQYMPKADWLQNKYTIEREEARKQKEVDLEALGQNLVESLLRVLKEGVTLEVNGSQLHIKMKEGQLDD